MEYVTQQQVNANVSKSSLEKLVKIRNVRIIVQETEYVKKETVSVTQVLQVWIVARKHV
jgi:hypothetical protein